jgi:hypothetical protein
VVLADYVVQVVPGLLAQQVHSAKVELLAQLVAVVVAVVTTAVAVAPWNAMPVQVEAVQAGSIHHS